MKRDKRFDCVLSLAERKALEKLAEHWGGLSLSATARILIRRAAREEGLWPPKTSSKV